MDVTSSTRKNEIRTLKSVKMQFGLNVEFSIPRDGEKQ